MVCHLLSKMKIEGLSLYLLGVESVAYDDAMEEQTNKVRDTTTVLCCTGKYRSADCSTFLRTVILTVSNVQSLLPSTVQLRLHCTLQCIISILK